MSVNNNPDKQVHHEANLFSTGVGIAEVGSAVSEGEVSGDVGIAGVADVFLTGAEQPLGDGEGWSADGLLVGRFRLERPLGRGGMGEVWRAWDEREQKACALKRLLFEPHNEELSRKRFVREFEILRELRHPNVVEIDELFPQGPFFSMELLEGRDLRQLLDDEKVVELELCVSIFTQICAALEQTHRQGLVHRDLKPGNVFFVEGAQTAGHPKVKLLDFGVALVQGETRFTQHGGAVGTAYYLAPELLKGGEVSPAADIYSCGVLLYEMLVGELPSIGAGSLSEELKRSATKPFERRHAASWGVAQWEATALLEGLYKASILRDPSRRESIASWRRTLQNAAQILRGGSSNEVVLEARESKADAMNSVESTSTSALSSAPLENVASPQTRSKQPPKEESLMAGWWLLVLLPIVLLALVFFQVLSRGGEEKPPKMAAPAVSVARRVVAAEPASLGVVKDWLGSSEVAIRIKAVRALGTRLYRPQDAVSLLRRVLVDPEQAVKFAAISSLRGWGVHARSALPELRNMLGDESSPRLSAAARDAIAAIKNPYRPKSR